MQIQATPLDGVLVLQPRVIQDARGLFFEAHHHRRYSGVGIKGPFVQVNVSTSKRGVLRGLHFQDPHPQGKLVQVLCGAVFDVAVDLRPDSPTYLQWFGVELSDANRSQIWIPPGLAHGFYVLSDEAQVMYQCSDYYAPEADRVLRWDDPRIGIEWPITGAPILAPRDANAPCWRQLRRSPSAPDERSAMSAE